MNDLAAFRDARDWARHHTPRNLAEALSVEAGELLQCFLWDGGGLFHDIPAEAQDLRVKREVADVLIYALNLCLALRLDPETIVREKMAANANKYPEKYPA